MGQYDLIWTLCWSWMHPTVKAGSETNLLPNVITLWLFVITAGVLSKWLFGPKNQSSDEATWEMRHSLLVVFKVIVDKIASNIASGVYLIVPWCALDNRLLWVSVVCLAPTWEVKSSVFWDIQVSLWSKASNWIFSKGGFPSSEFGSLALSPTKIPVTPSIFEQERGRTVLISLNTLTSWVLVGAAAVFTDKIQRVMTTLCIYHRP